MSTRLETELAHMRRLLASPTSFRGWQLYLPDKAQRLARWDPQEYADLPQLLTAEMKRLELSHSQPKQPERDTRS